MFRVQRSRPSSSRPSRSANLMKDVRIPCQGGQLLDTYSVYRVVKQFSSRTTMATLACSVIGLLALSGVSSTPDRKASDDAKREAHLFNKKLNKDRQILHALDRLSFGP